MAEIIARQPPEAPPPSGWPAAAAADSSGCHSAREAEIELAYRTRSADQILPLCSYATRPIGMLDILLSGRVLCSNEVYRLLGRVDSHCNSMRIGTTAESFDYFSLNDSVHFSAGLVCFHYSQHEIYSHQEFNGGCGVLVPLSNLLKRERLGFSHCSSAGGIQNFSLNRDNIRPAFDRARLAGELVNDGYGDLFEISLEARYEQPGQWPQRVLEFPQLELGPETLVALPESERAALPDKLRKRQELYLLLREQIISQLESQPDRILYVDGREILDLEQSLAFLERLLLPFQEKDFPIHWYSERNLQVALQALSINPAEYHRLSCRGTSRD